MTAYRLVQLIIAGVVALSGLIEITPIKINPISTLLKWIGDRLTGDMRQQLMDIRSKVDDMEKQLATDEVDKIRNDMLKFGRECRKKEQHTKKQFEQIIYLYKKYEDLVEKYDIDNGVLELEYDYIVSVYKRCLQEGAFL